MKKEDNKIRIMGNAKYNDEFPVNIGFGYNYGGDNWIRSDVNTMYIKETHRGYGDVESSWEFSVGDEIICSGTSLYMMNYVSEYIRELKINNILNV